MSPMAEAAEALVDMRLVEIRRVLNIVIVLFRPDDGVDHTIHAQCSFRVMHGDVILLGSRDMRWPKQPGADRDEAFDSLTTMYDAQAAFLTSRFAEGDFRVTGTELGPGGLLVVEAVDDSDLIRLEVIPETSGPKVESWRLFARDKSSEHFVYPEAAGRD
jgi:hypothetical protein